MPDDTPIPELGAIIQLPHASHQDRQSNSGRFVELAEALKSVVEAPDGVRVAFLNTPGVFGCATNRDTLLSVARAWADWRDAADNVVFYAVLCVWWVVLGPDGCASAAAAGIIEPLINAVMPRTGGFGAGSLAAMRVCSIIARLVSELPPPLPLHQAPQEAYGAAPEVIAAFGCRILALFPDRPAACPALTNESQLVLNTLRGRALGGGVLVAGAAVHGLDAHCFSGDGASALAEHARNAMCVPGVAEAVSSLACKPLLKAAERWPAHAGVQEHTLSALFNMSEPIPVRTAMAHAAALVVRAVRAATAALRRHDSEVKVLAAATRVLWQPCSNAWGVESLTGPLMLSEGTAAALVAALSRHMRETVPAPGAIAARDYELLGLALQLLALWMRHPEVVVGFPEVPGFKDLVLGIAAVYFDAEPGAPMPPGLLGGGPVPGAPEGVKVALGAVLARLANNGPPGPRAAPARELAAAALEIIG